MANSKQNNMTVTDLVKDDYKLWKNEFVIFDCGTGTGKTYFALNVLAPYARIKNKSVLYLCNRRKLREDIERKVKSIPFVTIQVWSYQTLQKKILSGKAIEQYDYIVADEIHYIFSDAMFNNYTDLAYDFLMKQVNRNNVVIYMSATAKSFFAMLVNKELVKQNRVYHTKKSYEYVDAVLFYKKESLTAIIDEILQISPKDKIVVFCNSTDRMIEMHDIYKNYADYYCAEKTENNKLKKICNTDCINEYDKNYITFKKSILFTTKALDNGVDLKDSAIKHIFTELFDLDCMVQALGRKRSLSEEHDKCKYYIRIYPPKAINCFANKIKSQLEPILLLKSSEETFRAKYGNNRDKIKKNKILYDHWYEDVGDADNKTLTNGKVCINEQRYIKYLLDNINIKKMQSLGYIPLACEWLGEELTKKIQILDIKPLEIDLFLEYIKSILNRPLYEKDQNDLKAEFTKIGLKDKKMGICTLNGRLQDDKYPFKIFNKDDSSKEYRDYKRKNSDGTENINYKKRYWIIKNYSWDSNSYPIAN
jgi:hypothetical protein